MTARVFKFPVALATLAVALAFAWQDLTVHYNYGGNWTALFGSGALFAAPPDALTFEHVYRFPDSRGYDGQIYHIMAHDPFLARGFLSTLESPRFRYRRILVPFLAWAIALGRDRLVDRAYVAVILSFVFLGTLWVAALARLCEKSALWGLSFLAVPAVAVSLDRMTVDIALVALIAGASYYARKKNWAALFFVCMFAGLVRETGLLVSIGVVLWFLFQRSYKCAAKMAFSSAPTLLWYLYVYRITPAHNQNPLSPVPFRGLLTRLASPSHYQFSAALNLAATALDYLALLGILLSVLYCLWNARHLTQRAEGWIALGFAALVVFISSHDVWRDAFSFARVFSPLLFLTALDSSVGFLPLLITVPRIWLQFGFQLLGVLHGLRNEIR